MVRRNMIINQALEGSFLFFAMHGDSAKTTFRRPSLKKVYNNIGNIAATHATVLITGETGVGKEIIARAIHKEAGRPDQLFISINAAAMTDTLFESSIFGHEKGAFTGATDIQKGKFELANGGTVFLDEVGDIPMGMQVKLLTTLETRSFLRVGGDKSINTDFQLICATNQDLHAAVSNRTFRSDLFYRIDVIRIHIPPIREYPEDIEFLARKFLTHYAERFNRPVIPYEGVLKKNIENHRWPGNVRQLESHIIRVIALNDEKIPVDVNNEERTRLIDALEKEGWKKVKAAIRLKISRSQLYILMTKYGIPAKKPNDHN